MKEKTPPRPVVLAACLFLAYGLLSLLRIWIFGRGLPSSALEVGIWCLAIALFALIAAMLYAGRNWVRLLVASLVAISVVAFPFLKPEMPEGPELWVYVLQIIMPIAACALTFTKRANCWFQA